jgi:hypothetical protein
MMQVIKVLIVLAVFMTFAGCATTPGEEGYHTQLGASLGAGLGAIGGQLVGGSDGATLIGAALGSLFGAIVGSEVDEQYQAVEEPAVLDRGRHDRAADDGYTTGSSSHRTDPRKGAEPAWEEEPLISGRVDEARGQDGLFETRY